MPLGSFLPCFYLRYSHHWVGGFSPCIWGFLRHRVHYGWREAGGAPPSSHRHLYCVQGRPVLRLQSGPGVAVPSWLQGQDPGPYWCCCPVTCGHGCRSGWEARDVCSASQAATGFWSHGFRYLCQGSRVADTDSAFPSVIPPLCVPIHPPLGAHMSVQGYTGILLCWGCFTGYGLKRRDRSNFSPYFCMT